MKVSLNLAQDYANVDLKSIPRAELLRRIGAQLGAVEDTIDWSHRFDGAVIVGVVSCEKHPNADKLSVCMVDDGGKNPNVKRSENGLVQVVCGAPNVRAGMFAVWLAPGVTVPNSRDTDPFVLEARDIRGVVSNGMMASAHELGISEDHSGIVEVTAEDAGREPIPGEPVVNYFGLDDFVIDCENKMFTHRPDCFGVLGVARELAGISGLEFKSPDWYLNSPTFEKNQDLPLTVKNEAPELVPRFMAVAMKSVTIAPSPIWLQATLTRVGIKPVNNVVDVTNYVMHLTGQPLHAFDYDKIKAVSTEVGIFPRLSKKGEKLTLLGQKEVELIGEEIVISTDKQAVALAGVMGGYDTEVDQNTKNIIIECATFDMYSIRRTSMRHGLFTDAVTRYNKGQSSLQNDRVLAYAMKNMRGFAGAEQASEVMDLKPGIQPIKDVQVSADFINARLGSQLTGEEMATLLANVEFSGSIEDGILTVTPPFWRMDIEEPEDVVEEIGRLHGYDKLPVSLPARTAKPAAKNKLFDFKMQLRAKLKEAGANEVLTYSFVHGDLLRKTGTDPEATAYHVRNAISPDLQFYRTSLLPSLLSKIHPNIKTGAGTTDNQFGLYEIGKVHVKGQEDADTLPKQMERLGMVVTADEKTTREHQSGAAYYLAKKYVDILTEGQTQISPLTDFSHPETAFYAEGRSALVFLNGQIIGAIGEFSTSVRKALKLPDFTAGFELDLELLMHDLRPRGYQPLPPFPGTSQDYTHEVSADVSWEAVYVALEAALKTAANNEYGVGLEPLNIFKADNTDTKRLTFRVYFNHPKKTMKTEEATELLVAAARILREKFPADEK